MPQPLPNGSRLLFIGSLRHFPNVSALRFFLDEVWPLLDGVELTVVAGPDPELHWQGSLPTLDRVRVLGYVADVKPLYDQTNIVIVPTLVSAGTNIKVLEAMAMERAVVSTPSGCAGLGLIHGESVWVADGAEGFAEGIRHLIEDIKRATERFRLLRTEHTKAAHAISQAGRYVNEAAETIVASIAEIMALIDALADVDSRAAA